MRPNLHDYIKPNGVYTGAQLMELAEIPSSTFYLYVKNGKIPKHERAIDSKTVFLGHEVLNALTAIKEKLPDFLVKPKRGRPRKI